MGWRENVSPKRAWNEARVGSCIFIIIGSYLIFMSIHHIFFPWDRTDFIQYNVTLESNPEFEKSRSGPSLILKFKEAKGFEFTIDGDNYTVLQNKDAIKELKLGSQVSVLVDKDQFNAKITRTQSPTITQRIFNWKWIRVYEFKSINQTFLSFDQVIKELKNVTKFYLPFGLICCVGSFFYLRFEYRKFKELKQ